MDQNMTFFTGLGCGVCFGISLFALRKYGGIFNKVPKAMKAFSANSEYKLALVVRSDLQMTKGKVATQCGHASVLAFLASHEKDPEATKFWQSTGQTKIALKTDSLDEIKRMDEKARQMGVISSMVCDKGRTQVAPNTVTVLGVSPAPQEIVNQITGHLKLLRNCSNFVLFLQWKINIYSQINNTSNWVSLLIISVKSSIKGYSIQCTHQYTRDRAEGLYPAQGTSI